MRKTRTQKILSLILLLVLSAAIALSAFGCDDKKDDDGASTTAATTTVADGTTVATTTGTGTTVATTNDPSVRGEGETEFIFKVTSKSDEEKTFTVRTNKTIVGEALLEVGLIDGEDGPYGLYVKQVDGETLDYDTDGKYWAFFVDGDYAIKGVDSTEIEAGKVYSFKPAS